MTGEETLSVEARLIADLGAQMARLTQQVTFRDMIITELKHEVKTERAAVVAYLRAPGTSCDTEVLAGDIERGDHREEER
jgi:hypothetical protein